MEWVHEGLPPLGSLALAWMANGSVRRVVRDGFYGDLRFIDCMHPEENVCCDPESVKAWRVEEPQANMPVPVVSTEWGWLASLLGL